MTTLVDCIVKGHALINHPSVPSMIPCQVLGRRHRSLDRLLHDYCGVVVNKTLQLSDWTCRPLSTQQVEYARIDVHFLCHLAAALRIELSMMPCQAMEYTNEAAEHCLESALPCPSQAQAALKRVLVLSQQATLQLYSKPDSKSAILAATNSVLKRAMAEQHNVSG